MPARTRTTQYNTTGGNLPHAQHYRTGSTGCHMHNTIVGGNLPPVVRGL